MKEISSTNLRLQVSLSQVAFGLIDGVPIGDGFLVTALSKSFAEKWTCSLSIITGPSTSHRLIWFVGANSFSIVQSTQTTNWGRGNYLSWISLHEHSRLISIASSNVYLCALDVCLIRIKNVTVEINKCLYMPASVLSQGQFPS